MLLLGTILAAQAQTELLIPGQVKENTGTDTLFVVPQIQLRQLLMDASQNDINKERIKLYQQQLALKAEKSFLQDSALHIQKLAAQYWYDQLKQNDQQLENQRIENLKLTDEKNRIRQSRIYYLVAGFVAGAVVVSL
jgi:hypothetical protein